MIVGRQQDDSKADAVKKTFRDHGGILRFVEARQLGINPPTLYRLRDHGVIQPIGRGLYRLAEGPPLTQPDLIVVARKIPRAVICLVSALAFHDLTDEVPHVVEFALPRGSEPPRLDHPPTHLHWFTGPAFSEGIETHEVDGIPVRLYGPEKTLADCFKYRNKIGMDVVLEAVRRYRASRPFRADELMHYARICRVHNVMRPYLEASAVRDGERFG